MADAKTAKPKLIKVGAQAKQVLEVLAGGKRKVVESTDPKGKLVFTVKTPAGNPSKEKVNKSGVEAALKGGFVDKIGNDYTINDIGKQALVDARKAAKKAAAK